VAFDFSGMSNADISTRLEDVSKEMVSLKDQLESAKVRRIETGEYADADWFRRTTTRLRHRGREHQALLVESGRRRRESRKSAKLVLDASRDRFFIRVALKRLPRELFEEIAREAEEIFAAGGSVPTYRDLADGGGDTISSAVLRWRGAIKRTKKALRMEDGADMVELMELVADVCENVASCDPSET
jgi:hypothetical protein